MIEKYTFGQITINGKEYTSDIIIFPDGSIKDSWWRSYGHRLSINDIKDLIETKPDIIIVGTGTSGLMIPEPDIEDSMRKLGIDLKVVPTQNAVKLYNKLYKKHLTGICLHMTC